MPQRGENSLIPPSQRLFRGSKTPPAFSKLQEQRNKTKANTEAGRRLPKIPHPGNSREFGNLSHPVSVTIAAGQRGSCHLPPTPQGLWGQQGRSSSPVNSPGKEKPLAKPPCAARGWLRAVPRCHRLAPPGHRTRGGAKRSRRWNFTVGSVIFQPRECQPCAAAALPAMDFWKVPLIYAND